MPAPRISSQPCALAQAAPLAGTDDAIHIHFDTRLRKREVTAPNANFAVRTEQTSRERQQWPLRSAIVTRVPTTNPST